MSGADFTTILQIAAFLLALYASGQVCKRVAVSAVIGEILVGVLLGPSVANLVPFPAVFELAGVFGVTLMIFESGLHVDFHTLRQVGARATAVAVLGTLLPLFSGLLMMNAFSPEEFPLWPTGLAVGVSLAPTSVGMALKMLGEAKQLDADFGQLIVAAAFVDDILSLVALTMLLEIGYAERSGIQLGPWNVMQPLVLSLLFCFFGCALALPIKRHTNDPPFKKYALCFVGFWPWAVPIMVEKLSTCNKITLVRRESVVAQRERAADAERELALAKPMSYGGDTKDSSSHGGADDVSLGNPTVDEPEVRRVRSLGDVPTRAPARSLGDVSRPHGDVPKRAPALAKGISSPPGFDHAEVVAALGAGAHPSASLSKHTSADNASIRSAHDGSFNHEPPVIGTNVSAASAIDETGEDDEEQERDVRARQSFAASPRHRPIHAMSESMLDIGNDGHLHMHHGHEDKGLLALVPRTYHRSSVRRMSYIHHEDVHMHERIVELTPDNRSKLAIMFIILLAYGTIANFIGSHLLGAFVGGMSFAFMDDALELWHSQVKRIAHWLVRLFFGATVAFAVPIAAMLNAEAIMFGLALAAGPTCFSKIVSGVAAGARDRWVVGAAMVGRGEFAFLVAQTARATLLNPAPASFNGPARHLEQHTGGYWCLPGTCGGGAVGGVGGEAGDYHRLLAETESTEPFAHGEYEAGAQWCAHLDASGAKHATPQPGVRYWAVGGPCDAHADECDCKTMMSPAAFSITVWALVLASLLAPLLFGTLLRRRKRQEAQPWTGDERSPGKAHQRASLLKDKFVAGLHLRRATNDSDHADEAAQTAHV